MFLPWASSARALCNTSKADSIPMRVIRSPNFMACPCWWMAADQGRPWLTPVVRSPPEFCTRLPRPHNGRGARSAPERRCAPAGGFAGIARAKRWLVRRLDPDERGVVLLREHVEVPIRSLTDVADSLTELAQHRLAADLLPLFVELDAIDLPGSRTFTLTQPADEHVALPS